MAIQEASYENEKELQCWVEGNVQSFLQNS